MFKAIVKFFVPVIFATMMLNGSVEAAEHNIKIDIYGINDLRGALRQESDYPGVAKLAGVLNKLKAENPQGYLLLGGGNMLFGTIESDENNGMPTVEAMNMMGFVANVTGSHFFDFKPEIFREQLAVAKFPYLACNVEVKQGTPLFKPYILTERAGVKIGLVGVTTRTTLREVSKENLANFTFVDSITSTQKYINEARQKGAEIIVLLMHCGVQQRYADGALRGEAIDVLRKLQGVDVVFTGDSQTVVTGRYNNIPVLQAGSHGRYIAKAQVTFNRAENKVVTVEEQMIKVNEQVVPADIALTKLIAPICQAVDAKFGELLAYNERNLNNSKEDQSLTADYLTDLLRKASKTDLAIINGGAFRSNLPTGQITARNIEEIYPFQGSAVILTLKGSDILAALDYGIDNKLVGQGRFSGVRLAVEPDMPKGSKIVDTEMPDGSKLEPSKEYRVLTNSFLAAGGDGYSMFKNATHTTIFAQDIKALLRQLVREEKNINYVDDYRFSVGEIRH